MAILLVDDSKDDLLLVASYLKAAGYQVVTVESAEAAFQYLARQREDQSPVPIDLILLDIRMPEFDGLDACKRFKAMKSLEDIPILMISADVTPGTIQLAFRRGAVDYLRKPVIKAELLAKVAMVLKIHQDASYRKQPEEATLEKAGVQVPVSMDVLTGIRTWWSFDELFEREWARAAQERHPLSLIFLALEDFKAFNDTYGYLTGDECLQKIAQASQEMFSQPDRIVARYRGAEFVVLLVGTEAEEAKSLAAHLHKTIEALDLGPVVDVGVATSYPQEGTSRANLLAAAKNALARRQGDELRCR